MKYYVNTKSARLDIPVKNSQAKQKEKSVLDVIMIEENENDVSEIYKRFDIDINEKP